MDGQVDETVAAELRKEKRSRSDKDEVSIHLWVNRVQTEIRQLEGPSSYYDGSAHCR